MGDLRFWPRRRAGKCLALGAGVLIVSALAGLPFVLAKRGAIPNVIPERIEIRSSPFKFNRLAPAEVRFGKLEWRGGLILSAPHPAFGGFSGLSLNPDGSRMLAVTDRGGWMSARLSYENGNLAGLSDARIGALLGDDGKAISGVRENDAESLAALELGQNTKPGQSGLNGHYLIGYEGYRQRIDEVSFKDGRLSAPLRQWRLPKHLGNLHDNKGLEGVTVLRGGKYRGGVIAFAERKLDASGNHTGALMIGEQAHPLFLRRDGSYDVTSLESLADGSLLILERSFIRKLLKLDIRLRLIQAAEIRPGARLEGKTLLEADRSYAIDNFEAMAVSHNKSGETRITLMSDDNFNFFQSTLLVQFALLAD